MALTNWGDILNKPKGIDEVPEIALTVEQLSASVLSISEDVGEIALDVSQLSASVLSITEDLNEINETQTYSITQSFTPAYDPNYTLKRVGKVVNFLIEGLWFDSITADTNLTVANIPTDLLPSNNITWTTPLVDSNGNVKGYARAYINKTSGELVIKSSQSISGILSVQGNLTWFI